MGTVKRSKTPLTKTQMRNLDRSIRKWERIVDGKDEDKRGDNCACCIAYYRIGNRCGLCPVKLYTSETSCDGTPWRSWARYMVECEIDVDVWVPFDKKSKLLAKKELAFLRRVKVYFTKIAGKG